MHRRFILIGSVLALVLGCGSAAAQITTDVNISQLQRDEAQYLKGGTAAKYYEQRIATERQEIRQQLMEDVDALITPAEGDQEAEPSKAIDRQRKLVDDLAGRLNESTVDLNLLQDEEQVYTGAASGSGRFMMTKSYPELLAKKVVLEEQVDLLSTALSSQQERLSKLLSEERSTSIGIFVTILWYIFIVFIVLTAEHFIRTQLLLRISHPGVRYASTKLFSILVYMVLVFWVAQRLYVEYPGLVTVFAVIGAAIVFMFQDAIKSIIGWMTYRGSMALGQRVTLGGVTGDVLDISMLFTTILVSRSPTLADTTLAGKIVRVPNNLLLTGTLANYHSTSDFENIEIPIYIADAAQWERAYKILEEVLREEAKGFSAQAQQQMNKRMRGFYYSQVSPSARVYMEFTEKRELMFVLCFPAPIGQRRATETKVLKHVLSRFDEESIRLAEPA